MRFLTKVYHCNINERGGIDIDILKDYWGPMLTVSKILLSLQSFLPDPNPGLHVLLNLTVLFSIFVVLVCSFVTEIGILYQENGYFWFLDRDFRHKTKKSTPLCSHVFSKVFVCLKSWSIWQKCKVLDPKICKWAFVEFALFWV